MGRIAVALARLAAPLFASAIVTPAMAQQSISGSLQASPANLALAGTQYTSMRADFSCSGAPICAGTYTTTITKNGCSPVVLSSTMTLRVDAASPPGPISFDLLLKDGGFTFRGLPNPPCMAFVIGDFGANQIPASWDGSRGTFSLGSFVDGGGNTQALYTGSFVVSSTPPVFPMTVTSNIGPVVSNATANIQFRPQDVGTAGSVYVFAVAPATKVTNVAEAKAAQLGTLARGAPKDDAIQCVLAQLNGAGQLQAVASSSLVASFTGVLSSLGQAVTILNNAPTPNITGATFYVGYGANAAAMVAAGINQRALAVPGQVDCNPQAPQTGWWWNPAEGGRGYSIEVAGNHIFFAAYLYDESGRATWLTASGSHSLDGSLFTGNMESYRGGQTLGGAYPGVPPVSDAGPVTLAFSNASHGSLSWAGRTIPIERFNIQPGGLAMTPRAGQPQAGWWWNSLESGRGFFLEWQGDQLFMAGYMYDEAGNPVWYLSSSPTTNLQSYANTWWLYGNGLQINNNVAPVTIQFQGTENALMTLPGGRTTALRRFRF